MVSAECIRCENKDYRIGLVYPFPRFLPGSFIYDYIISKENKNLLSLDTNKIQKIQEEVFLGAKRMAELQRMGDRNISQDLIKRTLYEHKILLTLLEKDMSFIETNNIDNPSLIKIYDYIDIQGDIANTYLTMVD